MINDPSGRDSFMQRNPKISVIIPVYNAEKYIAECIRSVQLQTFDDIEVICVDDGSTDMSAQLVREMAVRDSRIRILEKPNGGASTARNIGFDEAAGDYICFVDADDEILTDALQTLLSAAEQVDADIALANTYLVTKSGKRAKYPEQKTDAVVMGTDYEKYRLLSRNAVHAKLFRRSFLAKHEIRFMEGITYEDYHHWLECIAENPTIALSAQFAYIYKRNPYSISSSSKILEPYNIRSRIEQTAASIEVADSSQVPGLAAKTFRMQFGARMMRHIVALSTEVHKDRDKVEAAFNQLHSGIFPYRQVLYKKLHGFSRLVYALVIEGTLDELVKLLDWSEGRRSLRVLVDSHPEAPGDIGMSDPSSKSGKPSGIAPKIYIDRLEFPSLKSKKEVFLDVSDKVRRK